MFRLNNKGFAFSTILYGLLIMGIMVILLIMSTMQTNRSTNKNFVNTIEEELLNFSMTEAEFSSSQTYTVPKGQGGYYKIELWGFSGTYSSFLVNLSENWSLNFSIGNTTRVSCTSGCSISAASNSYASSYLNPYNLTSIDSGTQKAKIRKVSTTTPASLYFTNDGTYYIMRTDNRNTMKALTKNLTNDVVDFSTFTGEKNQKWTVRTIQNSNGKTFYMITNLGDDTSLQIAEGRDPTASGIRVNANKFVDVYVTSQNLDNMETSGLQGWQKWCIESAGSNMQYIISGIFNDDVYKDRYPGFSTTATYGTTSYAQALKNFTVDSQYYTYLTYVKKSDSDEEELQVVYRDTSSTTQKFQFIRAEY